MLNKSYKNMVTELKRIFEKAWSINSSSKWTIKNPAKGQCGFPALVVNDLFGGVIVKTRVCDA
ncbi:hypothetical protein JOC86_000239 [Bacillus pakistanensis]|uniref:Uncharacterized protein n=1 Tax=Rossellomorea pakistanensis TaxID=992288 RepID=A0ABS2N772_9BACI|nr:hypothetical protein [Bacillus pakistanensis]